MEGGIAHADIKKLSFPNNSVEDLVPVTLHAQGETVFQYGVVGDNAGNVFKRLSTYITANAMPAVHLACQYRVYAISPCAYIEQGYAGLGASLIRKWLKLPKQFSHVMNVICSPRNGRAKRAFRNIPANNAVVVFQQGGVQQFYCLWICELYGEVTVSVCFNVGC